ncbi:MAG: hypothetical protein R3B72_44430 [Polyangiaceae bacterium]
MTAFKLESHDAPESSSEPVRDSMVIVRKPSAELDAARQLIAQLRGEIERLGDALVSQKARYSELLDDERRERTALIEARASRARGLTAEIEKLRAENATLRRERAELTMAKEAANDAYRRALIGLQRAFQERIQQQDLPKAS